MTTLTDDELTELECAILDACAARSRAGWTIFPGSTFNIRSKFCCPLGALAGPRDEWERWLPSGFDFNDFVRGFDCHWPRYTATAECAMGRRFRERLERGEL